jgi:hypothetical protein
MSDAILKPVTRRLRVAVIAAESERAAALTQLVRSFGHTVVASVDEASVVLTDRATHSSHPVVALGVTGGEFQGRLCEDASPEQVDAALRAVAVGLSVSATGFSRRSFDTSYEDDDRVLLTPREIEVLRAVSDGLTNKEVALKCRAWPRPAGSGRMNFESLLRLMSRIVCSALSASRTSMCSSSISPSMPCKPP